MVNGRKYSHPLWEEGEKQLAWGHHSGPTPPMESLETQPYNSQPYNLSLETQPYNLKCLLTPNFTIVDKSTDSLPIHLIKTGWPFTRVMGFTEIQIWYSRHNLTQLDPKAQTIDIVQKLQKMVDLSESMKT